MGKLLEILKIIGVSAEETERICALYEQDPDGVMEYYLYLRAVFDDRHEYVE